MPQISSADPSILTFLSQVKDPRTLSGRRHHLAVVLLINIMAIMSGYTGVMAKQDFINANNGELTQIFDPNLIKHGLPSKNTIDRVMQEIDLEELNSLLVKHLDLEKETALHIDGKAIRSTTQNGQNSKQTFTSIVTVLAKKKGLSVGIASCSFVNGSKENEIGLVQEIIKALGLEGMVITLDALHCQKKLLN